MRVFIDTNVYLKFIEPNDEKLDALSNLRKNIKSQNINLLLPNITKDELFRSIPVVMGKYTKPIKEPKIEKPGFPAIVRDSKIRKKIERLYTEYPKLLNELIDEYEASVERLINSVLVPIVKNRQNIIEDRAVIESAKIRRLKGNPPGKGGVTPIGDEIEWELILDRCFDDDMVIVTSDGDWIDWKKGEAKLKKFLIDEWAAKSSKKILLYDTLSQYVKENIKDTKISEKEIAAEKNLDNIIDAPFKPASQALPSFVNQLSNLPRQNILSNLASFTEAQQSSIANLASSMATSLPSLSSLLRPTSTAFSSTSTSTSSSGLNKCIVCGQLVDSRKSSNYCNDHLENDPTFSN